MIEHQELSEAYASTTSRRVLQLTVVTLVFTALLDPGDLILHMKVPAFAAMIFVWLLRRGFGGRIMTQGMLSINLAIAVVIPLMWTIFGMMNHNAHNGGAQFGTLKSFLFLLIVPVLLSDDIDLASLIIRMGSLVALLTIAMLAVSLFSPVLFAALYAFTLDKGNALIDPSRDLLGPGIGMFYYKSSCLMIFPFSYYCSRLFQRGSGWLLPLLMCSLFGTALLISGTRANILAVLFVGGAMVLLWIRRTGGWVTSLAVGVLGVFLVAATVIPKYADTQEQGNAVKLGHFRSYEQEFATRPSVLLWGEGAGTAFYTEGVQGWMTNSELTYLELIRVFGLPMTILFGAGMVWIGYRLFVDGGSPIALAYIAYVAISASNPLLISSTGLLAICAMWKQAVKPSGPQSMFYLSKLYPRTRCEEILK